MYKNICGNCYKDYEVTHRSKSVYDGYNYCSRECDKADRNKMRSRNTNNGKRNYMFMKFSKVS